MKLGQLFAHGSTSESLIYTYLRFQSQDFLLRQSVRFRNNRYYINFIVQLLHEFDIQGFQTATNSSTWVREPSSVLNKEYPSLTRVQKERWSKNNSARDCQWYSFDSNRSRPSNTSRTGRRCTELWHGNWRHCQSVIRLGTKPQLRNTKTMWKL